MAAHKSPIDKRQFPPVLDVCALGNAHIVPANHPLYPLVTAESSTLGAPNLPSPPLPDWGSKTGLGTLGILALCGPYCAN